MPVSLPVGEQIKSYETGALRASYALTYSDTDHYYFGKDRDDATETNVAPATLGIEHVLGLEYDLARGFTLVGEFPFVHTEQSREFGGVARTMEANGLSSPPGYGPPGAGRAVFSVSSFMDSLPATD